MRLLLDTHVLLWFVEGDARLSEVAREAIGDPANERWVSVASAWEIAIKTSLGKLRIDGDLKEWLVRVRRAARIEWLSIDPRHVVGVAALPWHHRDPFDRLLIAQARTEGMTLVSADEKMTAYDVARIA